MKITDFMDIFDEDDEPIHPPDQVARAPIKTKASTSIKKEGAKRVKKRAHETPEETAQYLAEQAMHTRSAIKGQDARRRAQEIKDRIAAFKS